MTGSILRTPAPLSPQVVMHPAVVESLIATTESVTNQARTLLAENTSLKSSLAIQAARIERLTPDAERWRWWRKEYRAIDAIGDELDTLVDNEISMEGEG